MNGSSAYVWQTVVNVTIYFDGIAVSQTTSPVKTLNDSIVINIDVKHFSETIATVKIHSESIAIDTSMK